MAVLCLTLAIVLGLAVLAGAAAAEEEGFDELARRNTSD